ncbi:MAG: pilus assembly protein [Proteobacteria bacterium]|nr:pilus assembly protein [Pseudomonadota bacterium]
MRRDRRGSATVEFAILFPLLATLFLGVTDITWFAYHRMALGDSLWAGARMGAGTQDGEPEMIARDHAWSSWLDSGYGGQPDFTAQLTGIAPNQMLTLSASITLEPISGLILKPITLDRSLTVRLENQLQANPQL